MKGGEEGSEGWKEVEELIKERPASLFRHFFLRNYNLTTYNPLTQIKRYFGGIKLGAGGLVRAYGGVARTCLRNADTVTHIPKVLVRLTAPLSMSGAVFQVRRDHCLVD